MALKQLKHYNKCAKCVFMVREIIQNKFKIKENYYLDNNWTLKLYVFYEFDKYGVNSSVLG